MHRNINIIKMIYRRNCLTDHISYIIHKPCGHVIGKFYYIQKSYLVKWFEKVGEGLECPKNQSTCFTDDPFFPVIYQTLNIAKKTFLNW